MLQYHHEAWPPGKPSSQLSWGCSEFEDKQKTRKLCSNGGGESKGQYKKKQIHRA
jgi:hypothetical protein